MALQDQVDAIQAFQNFELPRKPTILTPGNTGYDGDPRLPAAPADLDNAPPGSFYNQATPDTFWRKDQSGTWVIAGDSSLIRAEGITIYVDPAGDDANDGLTPGTPIKTLNEARKRTPLIPLGVLVQLSAGDHELTDHDTLNGGVDRTRFVCLTDGLTIRGTTSIQQTVTVSGPPTDNVVPVVETLTPGALRGLVYHDTTAFPGFTLRNWVVDNGVNDVTFAWTVIAWGGFLDPPSSGTMDLRSLDSRVIPPTVNPSFFVNRFYYTGPVIFEDICFDGNGGGFTGPTSELGKSTADFDNETASGCKFIDWNQGGISNSKAATINACWFEDCASFGCAGSSVTGDSVFVDCMIAITGGGIIGAGVAQWNYGCFCFNCIGLGEQTVDFSVRVTTEPGNWTPSSHIRCDGFATYLKRNAPLHVLGSGNYVIPFRTQFQGGNRMGILDSVGTVVTATGSYIRFTGFGPFATLSIDKADFEDPNIYDGIVNYDPGQLLYG